MQTNRVGVLDAVIEQANAVAEQTHSVLKRIVDAHSPSEALYELLANALDRLPPDDQKRFWRLIAEHPDNPIQELEIRCEDLRERAYEYLSFEHEGTYRREIEDLHSEVVLSVRSYRSDVQIEEAFGEVANFGSVGWLR